MGFNTFLGINSIKKRFFLFPALDPKNFGFFMDRSQDVAVGLFADFLDGTRDLDEHLGPSSKGPENPTRNGRTDWPMVG